MFLSLVPSTYLVQHSNTVTSHFESCDLLYLLSLPPVPPFTLNNSMFWTPLHPSGLNWHPGCCSVVTDSTGDGNLCVPGVPPSVLTGVPSAGPALSTPRPNGPMEGKSIKRKWTSLWSHSYYNASIKVWKEMWGNLQFLHFRILPIFKDFFTLTLPLISSKWWCCPPRHLCTLFFSLHCD